MVDVSLLTVFIFSDSSGRLLTSPALVEHTTVYFTSCSSMGFHSTFRVWDEYFAPGMTETSSTLGSSVKPANKRDREESHYSKKQLTCVWWGTEDCNWICTGCHWASYGIMCLYLITLAESRCVWEDKGHSLYWSTVVTSLLFPNWVKYYYAVYIICIYDIGE